MPNGGGLNWAGLVPGSGYSPNSMFNPNSTGGGSNMPGGMGFASNIIGGLGNLFGGALGGNPASGNSSMFNPSIPGSSQLPGILGSFSNLIGGVGNFPGALVNSIGHLFNGTLGQHEYDNAGYGFNQGDTGPTADQNFSTSGGYDPGMGGSTNGLSSSGWAGGFGSAAGSGMGFWDQLRAALNQH